MYSAASINRSIIYYRHYRRTLSCYHTGFFSVFPGHSSIHALSIKKKKKKKKKRQKYKTDSMSWLCSLRSIYPSYELKYMQNIYETKIFYWVKIVYICELHDLCRRIQNSLSSFNDFQLARKKLKVVEICRDSIIFVHRQKGNRFLCEKHLILDHVASQASSTPLS
jgi:hypothetical protein